MSNPQQPNVVPSAWEDEIQEGLATRILFGLQAGGAGRGGYDHDFTDRSLADCITRDISGYIDNVITKPLLALRSELIHRAADANDENRELREEIARHHKDFARWEDMADKASARAARVESRIDALEREKGEALAVVEQIVGVLRRTGDSSTMRIVEIGRICESFAALPTPVDQHLTEGRPKSE